PAARIVVVPHHLDGGVVRLRARVVEEHFGHLDRHQRDEALRQLGGDVVRFVIEDMVVGQPLQLPSRRIGQPLLAEPQRGAPQPGQPLDIFLAVLVIDMDALALGDDERTLALVPLEMRIGMKVVGDIAAGGRIASLHGSCPRAWAIRLLSAAARASQTALCGGTAAVASAAPVARKGCDDRSRPSAQRFDSLPDSGTRAVPANGISTALSPAAFANAQISLALLRSTAYV